MSELERIRDENIRRNEEFLKSLGLNDIKPKPLETLKDDLIKNKKKEKKSKRIKKESSTNITTEVVRKSRRIRDEEPEHKPLNDELLEFPNIKRLKPITVGFEDEDGEEIIIPIDCIPTEKSLAAVKATELLKYIQESNEDHYDLISNKELIAHTTMRLNSMTIKAFANRIKQIGRHNGKQSCDKLLISFYAAKYVELHEIADAAHQMLLKKKILSS